MAKQKQDKKPSFFWFLEFLTKNQDHFDISNLTIKKGDFSDIRNTSYQKTYE